MKQFKDKTYAEYIPFEEVRPTPPAQVAEAQKPAVKEEPRIVRRVRVTVDRIPTMEWASMVILVAMIALGVVKIVAYLAGLCLLLVFNIITALLRVVERWLPWESLPDDAPTRSSDGGSRVINITNNININE